jgi:drug/metabolite transporter (DMT)-like permease
VTDAQRQRRFLTILCFALVYLMWGSTYLGIRIAVEHIPPALMCALRFTAAGALMLVYCKITGRFIQYTWAELGQLAVVGILLLIGGNCTVAYAERYVPSGLAALLVGIIPLWFLVLDSLLLGDHHISFRGLIGLVLGITGMVVLLWPQLAAVGTLQRMQFWFSLALLAAAFSWSLGSVLSKRWRVRTSLTAAAWEMVFAGLGAFLLAAFRNEFAHVTWTARGLGAVIYLIICGSLIGYTAYIWLLGHVTTSKLSTYAYVNPVVAVFLGWLILHEAVNGYILAGSAIVVAAVALVTTASVGPKPAVREIPVVEAVGNGIRQA